MGLKVPFRTSWEGVYHTYPPTESSVFSISGRGWVSLLALKGGPPALDLVFQIWRPIPLGLERAVFERLPQSAKIREKINSSSCNCVWNVTLGKIVVFGLPLSWQAKQVACRSRLGAHAHCSAHEPWFFRLTSDRSYCDPRGLTVKGPHLSVQYWVSPHPWQGCLGRFLQLHCGGHPSDGSGRLPPWKVCSPRGLTEVDFWWETQNT